jgi:hypothetical protein
MKQKIIMMIALLCAFAQGAFAQGAWAQDGWSVWDGSSETEPTADANGVYQINSAANMAYLKSHMVSLDSQWRKKNFSLNVNLDMTAGNWKNFGLRLATGGYKPIGFNGTFNGNGHTIRIRIDNDRQRNYQSLLGGIDDNGVVENLRVDGYIHCNDSRLVGAIAGENYGTIRNCWVSADVSSDWRDPGSTNTAEVGGICGENRGTIEYCCVTGNVTNNDADVGGICGNNDDGTISHCTFYGTRSSTHSQYNLYVGSHGTEADCYDGFNTGEWDAANNNGKTLYCDAIKYTYAINATTVGLGTIQVSAGGETGITRWHPEQTITLTVTSGTVVDLAVWKTSGGLISVSGNDADGYTFTMPRGDINVKVAFPLADGSIPMTGTTTTLQDGKTYRVIDDEVIGERIDVHGTVNLILDEGTTLHAFKGIELSSDNNANLTIDGTGALSISNCDEGKSGIGAAKVGTLTINGGTIDVFGGDYGAAIGGDKDNTEGGTITINGGVVEATGGMYAAGIGGGYNEQNDPEKGVCGTIVINGGQVTAKSTSNLNIGIGPSCSVDIFGGSGVGVTNSGTLTLSWTSLDDFVYIGGYQQSPFYKDAMLESVTFARQFAIYGTSELATAYYIQEGNVTSGVKLVPYTTTVLSDNADNTSDINEWNGRMAGVTLADRTLYKDGAWNTLCLPFNVDLLAYDCPLQGAVARPLTEASISGTTLNLEFGSTVRELVAGTPYIIKWNSGEDIVNPVFNCVTIDAGKHYYDTYESGASTDERVRFMGTYASMEFDDTDNSILLMGGDNMLYYPTTGAGLGAQRAYFKLGGDGVQHAAQRVTKFSINFGDGSTTTGVIAVDASEQPAYARDAWYTIGGLKLDGKPTQKGVFINNGIKVVIE